MPRPAVFAARLAAPTRGAHRSRVGVVDDVNAFTWLVSNDESLFCTLQLIRKFLPYHGKFGRRIDTQADAAVADLNHGHDDSIARLGRAAHRGNPEQYGADQQEMNERIFDELRHRCDRALRS